MAFLKIQFRRIRVQGQQQRWLEVRCLREPIAMRGHVTRSHRRPLTGSISSGTRVTRVNRTGCAHKRTACYSQHHQRRRGGDGTGLMRCGSSTAPLPQASIRESQAAGPLHRGWRWMWNWNWVQIPTFKGCRCHPAASCCVAGSAAAAANRIPAAGASYGLCGEHGGCQGVFDRECSTRGGKKGERNCKFCVRLSEAASYDLEPSTES